MVDVSSSWLCETAGRSLCDVLTIQNLDEQNQNHEPSRVPAPVLLSQPDESAPCLLSLRCTTPSAITWVELVTQARTAEVYDQSGEYCGTARGESDQSAVDSPDAEPFYRKRLILHRHTASCQVKLLSLCGRRRVAVRSVTAALEVAVRSGVSVNRSIDLGQVQCMMEEMGTCLSPGARHLLDLVQFQQQNHSSALTSLLPGLVGGRAPSQLTPPAAEAASNQNGALSHDSDSPCSESSESRSPVSPAHITEMMSQLAMGRGQAPDLLPVLQSVCGHVTQLRLDNGAALRETSDGARWLDLEMERRLEQMEQRLKQHVDKRLDVLEQKLDSVLKLLINRNIPHLTSEDATEEPSKQTSVSHQ